MNYDETVELEENIKIKNKAIEIYDTFMRNVKLDASKYKGNHKFELWSDQYNEILVVVKDGYFEFECNYLHETYRVAIKKDSIFDAIKKDSRVIGHLKATIS